MKLTLQTLRSQQGPHRNDVCGLGSPGQSRFAAASNPKARAELFNYDIMPISSCSLSYKQLVTAWEKNLPSLPFSDQGFPLGRKQTQTWLPTPQPYQQPV